MHSRDDKIQKLVKNLRDELTEQHPSWPHEVQRVVAFINENWSDERLDIKWLETHCHVNGKDFSGRFRFYVGRTPQQYWIAQRIAAAKKLLRNKSLADVSIIDIAFSLGFRKPSTFSTTFKNHTGCSPRDFRNRDDGCS